MHAAGETLILVDPDGDELVLQTDGAIGLAYGLGLELAVDAEAQLHLGPVMFTAQDASPFSPGYALVEIDGLSYAGAMSALFADTVNVASPTASLNCISAGGVPMFPASAVDANVDGSGFDLREGFPAAVAQLSPRPEGGVTLAMFSTFDDMECGAEFENDVFVDSLEVLP